MAESMAYVGYCDACGGMVSACVDAPDSKRDTARWVAKEVREGNRIERVTCQFVRENLNGCTDTCGCKWCVEKRAKKAVAAAKSAQVSAFAAPVRVGSDET